MNVPVRRFDATPAVRTEEPLLIGLIGPPGGGKTLSALKLAKGVQRVRTGDIIVIDTEGGRSRKYADAIPFLCHEFQPPCRPEDFLAAIKHQLARNPACVIVDSLSDEHEGEGGYLEWHDEMVPKMGGNEWAAWAKPKASRKKLISGLLHIKTPLIFTFRAREKTKQNPNAQRAQDKIINIGWQPVAPLEIVHTLDLACVLPPRADGVPVWKSDKVGEDFIIKLPNYLKPFITEGHALSEDMGEAFAKWARGGISGHPADVQAAPATPSSPPAAGAATIPSAADYVERWRVFVDGASTAAHGKQIAKQWNDEKTLRQKILWPEDNTFDRLKEKVSGAVKILTESAAANAK